jgi:hypothetical protein
MKNFTQTCSLLIVYIAISITTLANDERNPPSPFITARFMASVKRVDSIIAVNTTAKVCACQILNLRSNNHYVNNAVVFAEKTNKEGEGGPGKSQNKAGKRKAPDADAVLQ